SAVSCRFGVRRSQPWANLTVVCGVSPPTRRPRYARGSADNRRSRRKPPRRNPLAATPSMRPLATLLLTLLGGCAPIFGARPGPDPLPTDPEVRLGQLENGLRYYIRENREPRARAELRLVVNAGSVLEGRDQRGLAHLVEHMAFNGTANFEKQALVDYLER